MIILTYNTSRYLHMHRNALIRAIAAEGREVVAVAPRDDMTPALVATATQYHELPLQQHGLNPIHELKTLCELYRIFRAHRPSIVVNSTIKLNIYGSIAARMAGVKNIYSMVNGLGYVFSGDTIRQRVLQVAVRAIYRFALRRNTYVFFQNSDDATQFINLRVVRPSQTLVIKGVGVDTHHFRPMTVQPSTLTFLMIARLLRDKGINEYVEAARIIKQKHPQVRCLLVGPYDSNPTAIRREDVVSWQNEGLISYLGTINDVRPIIAQCSAFVLPSYREGLPQAVLEAMAMGKAIITTNAPGCKDTVLDGYNGFIVPVQDHIALSSAMERLIDNPELLDAMGRNSRQRVMQEFDMGIVNHKILRSMGIKTNKAPSNPTDVQLLANNYVV